MLVRLNSLFLCLFLLFRGCSGSPEPSRIKFVASGGAPQVLALYEAWFGLPNHISSGYSSQDPEVLRGQIRKAKTMGITTFVVDWFGDREPAIDKSYASLQALAAQEHFQIAMMYDEANQEEGATDETIADFTMFHDAYLSSQAKGHDAYLTYQGRPVIFIFPHGSGHTDWSKVRATVNKWSPAPLLIDENLPAANADAFDGFYPWINPGAKGWAADGSNWGEDYLTDFYQTMDQKFSDKIIVGGAWAKFDDSKASWGLNRHISDRCGQTYRDTFDLWRKFVPADQVIPFVMVETWNDYEEGSAVEPGLPTCAAAPTQPASAQPPSGQPAGQAAAPAAPQAPGTNAPAATPPRQ